MTTLPPTPPMVCVRRPGTVWPSCTCPDCRAHMARMAKLARNGHYRRVPATAAWAVLDHWATLGWTGQAMASAAGVARRTIEGALVELRRTGHRQNFGPNLSRTIVAARDQQPTAGMVGALGSMRRLQALAVQGYGLGPLSTLTGVPESSLSVLRGGGTTRVAATRAAAITDTYRALSGRFGGDQYAANLARLRGWPSALTWHNPDNPAEQPTPGDTPVTDTRWRGMDIAELEWILDQQPAATTQQLADRFGVTRTAIQHALARAGRDDILARLTRNVRAAA